MALSAATVAAQVAGVSWVNSSPEAVTVVLGGGQSLAGSKPKVAVALGWKI